MKIGNKNWKNEEMKGLVIMKDLIVHKGAERPKSCVVRLILKGRSGGFYLLWVSFRFLSQVYTAKLLTQIQRLRLISRY